MKKLNHKMIQLARESRGYTQTELAIELGIPQGNLSRMETGDYVGIKEELLGKFSTVLNYPESFFYQTNEISISDTHYRKTVSLDQRTKLQAEAIMNIYKFNVEEMLRSLDLSTNNIPFLKDYETPEKVAKYLRSYWKIPRGAVDNLTDILEQNGIIVIQVDFGTDKLDGRTIIANTGHPIIFLNSKFSGDRMKLTCAHELGHVLLHINSIPVMARDEEDEAFRFASEFLMPIEEVKYDIDDNLSIEKLIDLKRIWKVSIQSILFRAQKQELVKYNRCRYLWSIISSKGWRKKEPIDVPKETPTLLNRMSNMFINELEFSKAELANLFKLNESELIERYFPQPNKLRVV